MDRFEALSNLIALPDTDIVISKVINEALKDKFWYIRQYAAKNLGKALVHNASVFRQRLIKMAQEDEKSSVRATAIEMLAKEFTGNDLNNLYKELLNDPSYMVIGAALEAYGKKQPEEALKFAKDLEKETNSDVMKAIAGLYIEKGSDEQNPFFLSAMEKLKGGNLYMFLQSYGKFIIARTDKTIMESLPALETIGKKNNSWYIRLSAVQILNEISLKYEKEESAAKEKFNSSTKEGKSPEEITKLGNELTDATKKRETVSKMVEDIKKGEKDSNLVKIYGTKS
jgi:aminopeptidase N